MGLLTDLFVATESDARRYDSNAAAVTDRVQLGDLTNLPFERLWAILERTPWDVRTHALREIVGGPESFVYEFPDRYVGLLRGLTESDVAPVSAAWARTEELSATPEEVAPVIRHLTKLAGTAEGSGRKLFVWFLL